MDLLEKWQLLDLCWHWGLFCQHVLLLCLLIVCKETSTICACDFAMTFNLKSLLIVFQFEDVYQILTVISTVSLSLSQNVPPSPVNPVMGFDVFFKEKKKREISESESVWRQDFAARRSNESFSFSSPIVEVQNRN